MEVFRIPDGRNSCHFTTPKSVYRVASYLGLIAFFLCALFSSPAVSNTGLAYDVFGIVPEYNGSSTEVTGINERGQMVGNVGGPMAPEQAFLWTPSNQNGTSGVLTDLHPNSTIRSQARAINELGQVAGQYRYNSGGVKTTTWRWDPTVTNGTSGSLHNLGTLLGGRSSQGSDINDSGQVAGFSHINGCCDNGGFLTQPNQNINDADRIPDPSGLRELGAFGVNNLGHATGDLRVASGKEHLFLFDGTNTHDLGSLGGSLTRGNAINDSGVIAGTGNTVSGEERAFIWTPSIANGITGSLTSLGTLGGDLSNADDINEMGFVVGSSRTTDGEMAGFVFDGLSMINLNDVIDPSDGWFIQRAGAINDLGQIGATAINADGQRWAVLLQPTTVVPVPTAAWLFGSALLGLLSLVCRRA